MSIYQLIAGSSRMLRGSKRERRLRLGLFRGLEEVQFGRIRLLAFEAAKRTINRLRLDLLITTE